MNIDPRFLNGAARRRKHFKAKVPRKTPRQRNYTTYYGNPADAGTPLFWCETRIDMGLDRQGVVVMLFGQMCFKARNKQALF
jgi:hypothetical protein